MKLNRKLALFFFTSLFSAALLMTQATRVSATPASRAGTYVGHLEGQIDLIGIDVTQADAKNRRIVRAYLCDGELGGDARWYTGVMVGNKVRLTSTDGATTLEVKLGHDVATGFLIFGDGSVRGFSAPRAVGGGGIWEIEVTADGVARGVSLAGDAFIATKSSDRVSNIGDGRPWETTVTTVNGESFHYLNNDLTTFSVAELESYGLPTVYATTGLSGVQPGAYTVIWLTVDHRFGFSGLLFGRSADVKRGVPGTNIWTGSGDPTL
jgi:hypothetical protein